MTIERVQSGITGFVRKNPLTVAAGVTLAVATLAAVSLSRSTKADPTPSSPTIKISKQIPKKEKDPFKNQIANLTNRYDYTLEPSEVEKLKKWHHEIDKDTINPVLESKFLALLPKSSEMAEKISTIEKEWATNRCKALVNKLKHKALAPFYIAEFLRHLISEIALSNEKSSISYQELSDQFTKDRLFFFLIVKHLLQPKMEDSPISISGSLAYTLYSMVIPIHKAEFFKTALLGAKSELDLVTYPIDQESLKNRQILKLIISPLFDNQERIVNLAKKIAPLTTTKRDSLSWRQQIAHSMVHRFVKMIVDENSSLEQITQFALKWTPDYLLKSTKAEFLNELPLLFKIAREWGPLIRKHEHFYQYRKIIDELADESNYQKSAIDLLKLLLVDIDEKLTPLVLNALEITVRQVTNDTIKN